MAPARLKRAADDADLKDQRQLEDDDKQETPQFCADRDRLGSFDVHIVASLVLVPVVERTSETYSREYTSDDNQKQG